MILAEMRSCGAEIATLDSSLGRVVAEDVIAGFPLPPWTNASMDGYAVRASDVRGASVDAPVTLRLIATSRAGGAEPPSLEPGCAIRIFTGALVPSSADSVIRQEHTTADGVNVRILSDADALANVRPAGGDLAEGSLAIQAGDSITPGALAMLAALGVTNPHVHRKPRVGILVTGDELVPVHEHDATRARRQLVDVNGPMLAALIREAGGEPHLLGIAPDNPEAIRASITNAGPFDLLITAGGVSVGDHDHVPEVVVAMGCDIRFRRVRVRPGGPTSFGIFPDGRPWLGLPGNPVSAFVTFHLFGRPAIRRLAGAKHERRARTWVILEEKVARDATLDLYLRVRLSPSESGAVPGARLTGGQGSGMLTSIVAADALLILEAGTEPALAGSMQRAIPCTPAADYLSV